MIKIIHFQIGFWVCLLSTVALSLIPISGQPLFELQDKLGHASAYAILFFLAVKAYGHRIPIWLLGALIVGFGFFIELAQSMTSHRYGDPWDLLANTMGGVAIWLSFSIRRK